MVKHVRAFWKGDLLLLNTHLKRVHLAPLTTFHKIKYLPPLHMAKGRGLCCTADASIEIRGPCVPIAWGGHSNCSPVNTPMFRGRDAKVIAPYVVKGWGGLPCPERAKQRFGFNRPRWKMWLCSVTRGNLVCSWWGYCRSLLSRKSTKR